MAFALQTGTVRAPRGRLAQLVERFPYKEDVGGSSPSSPTTLHWWYRALHLHAPHRNGASREPHPCHAKVRVLCDLAHMNLTHPSLLRLGGVVALASAVFLLASTQAPAVDGTKWDWLANTTWIVKHDGLPAMVHVVASNVSIPVQDQTVYHIDRCVYGYFTGRAATQIGTGSVECSRLLGSVAPDGRLQLNFLTVQNGTIESQVSAGGDMLRVRNEWTMRNQMSSVAQDGGTVVLHWAHMYRVTPNDPEWHDLPFVHVSVPQFLGQCP